ncbi:3-hydroxyacyl-ACP dehydratase [Mucilaginibacter sp. X4EP1]|uniref:3-hydroxyacyl-ACP dehydratase n=1 Tax=Mucilaginibacter sp. X4EP1 TaxID=2723092 RepID=UPI002168162C|nr:3-hydroxyacyl-ACP dehydratase [Mucilaginibacter sp. X4EP1]MCS3815811.1 putative hotdog family 3-hydroxylacyl-ACP dehydratase [Mucilaginibacter sp. X4EP1]
MVITDDILSFIPQRPPFVMVDKLLYCDEFITQTSFKVIEDNVLVIDDVFTEAGMMENIAQTAAMQAGYIAKRDNKLVAIGYIGAVKNFEVFDLPKTNDELVTTIRMENQVFDVTIISGVIKCKDVIMARCEMNIFIRE